MQFIQHEHHHFSSNPRSEHQLQMATTSTRELFSVAGQIFVIAGGGSGLGEWMAQAFDANGASKVFILGRRQASLDRVAASAVYFFISHLHIASLTLGRSTRQSSLFNATSHLKTLSPEQPPQSHPKPLSSTS